MTNLHESAARKDKIIALLAMACEFGVRLEDVRVMLPEHWAMFALGAGVNEPGEETQAELVAAMEKARARREVAGTLTKAIGRKYTCVK